MSSAYEGKDSDNGEDLLQDSSSEEEEEDCEEDDEDEEEDAGSGETEPFEDGDTLDFSYAQTFQACRKVTVKQMALGKKFQNKNKMALGKNKWLWGKTICIFGFRCFADDPNLKIFSFVSDFET